MNRSDEDQEPGPEINSVRSPDGVPERFQCPCCRNNTLSERGVFDICPVCFWEDDGQDDHDAEVVRGGPNGALSLALARENYREFGACQSDMLQHVRRPTPDELPNT